MSAKKPQHDAEFDDTCDDSTFEEACEQDFEAEAEAGDHEDLESLSKEDWAKMNRATVDRRAGLDRRLIEKRKREKEGKGEPTGLERRRGPGRRRSDFMRSAEEGEMTDEQFVFITAIETFKRANNKVFPTWTDVLEVVRLLGYRKTLPCELNLRNIDDFTEQPDAPSKVTTRDGKDLRAA